MKFKFVVIVVALLWTVSLGAGLYLLRTPEQSNTNIVELNDGVKQLEDQYAKSQNLPDHWKGAQVASVTDPDYVEVLTESMKNGHVIADILAGNRLVGKLIWPLDRSKEEYQIQFARDLVIFIFVFLAIIMAFLLSVIYRRMIRPFCRMQKFAKHVAQGDLDFPLYMERNNYFGDFTVSFDIMREELKRARMAEQDANRSKRQLVAELSHDIKTPVASIQANCELLQLTATKDMEKNKLQIIQNKTQVINNLVNNLFEATLSELNVIRVVPSEQPSTILREMFQDMDYYGYIKMETELPECIILCDPIRLTQVIDNIISNSYKYAKTPIHVQYGLENKMFKIAIRDEGPGISEEDLPLVLEKYYRGQNSKQKEGSGLGLYISHEFMKRMQGDMMVANEDGFCVHLTLSLI